MDMEKAKDFLAYLGMAAIVVLFWGMVWHYGMQPLIEDVRMAWQGRIDK